MPRARRAALLGGGVSAYVDLNFAAGKFKAGTSSAGDLTALPGFTFTRASLAMGYDATGKLTYGPNNLCPQSQTFATSPWSVSNASISVDATAAPDGSLTADKLVENTATSDHRVQQSTTAIPSGARIVFSLYMKAAERTKAKLYTNIQGGSKAVTLDLSAGSVTSYTVQNAPTITSAGNGWWRVSWWQTADVASTYAPYVVLLNEAGSESYTGDGTSGLFLWGAQLEAVTYQTTPSTYYPTTTAAYYGPRLVYDPVTLASLGILVEEARTNSVVQSQDFNTSWTLSRASVSVNATTSPDGTSNADRLFEDSVAANTHRIFGTATTTAAAWTWSVYAKASTRSWIYLRIDRNGGTTPNAWFDLANGVVGTAETGLTSSIQNVGNGWYRCVVTVDTATAASNSPLIGLSTGNGVLNYNGDGTSGAFIWQAQLEAGQGASSPIPTPTASVTRAADVAAVTGLSVADGCTVLVEGRAPDFVSTDARCGISDGTTGNRLVATYSGGAVAPLIAVASVTQGLGSTTLAAGVAFKSAISSQAGSYAGSVNGSAATTFSGGTMPTLTQMDIGTNVGGGRSWNQATARIRVWKTVKPVTSLTS